MEASGIFGRLNMRPLSIKTGRKLIKGETGFAGLFQTSILGIALVIGGHVVYWHEGLRVGTYEFLLGSWVFASGYFCLALCLAEMISVLPFAGGLYGFIRVTTGPYPGFLVGCCEILQNVTYIATLLYPAGHYTCDLFSLPHSLSPIFWTILLAVAIFVNVMGPQWFWNTNTVVTLITLVLLLVYWASAFSLADCANYGGKNFHNVGSSSGAGDWFRYMPFAGWFFVGLEMLPVACGDSKGDPKTIVPKAFVYSFLALLVSSTLLILSTGCGSRDVSERYSHQSTALEYAYSRSLNLADRTAQALAIPALFCSASALCYVGSRQMRSLAESGLIPGFLKSTHKLRCTPHRALVGLGLGCLALLFLVEYSQSIVLLGISAISYFATTFVCVLVFIGYMTFRSKYAGLPKLFKSPLGTYGAFYGGFVLVLEMVCIIVTNALGWVPLVVFSLVMSALTVYYIVWVRPYQGFSEEEQKVMFVAYVINANRRTKIKYQVRRSSERSMSFSLPLLLTPAHHSSSKRSLSSEPDAPLSSRGKRSLPLPSPLRSTLYTSLASALSHLPIQRSRNNVNTSRAGSEMGDNSSVGGDASEEKLTTLQKLPPMNRNNTGSTYETSGRVPTRSPKNFPLSSGNSLNSLHAPHSSPLTGPYNSPTPLNTSVHDDEPTVSVSSLPTNLLPPNLSIPFNNRPYVPLRRQHLDQIYSIDSSPPSNDEGDHSGASILVKEGEGRLEDVDGVEGEVTKGHKEEEVEDDRDDIFNVEDNKNFHSALEGSNNRRKKISLPSPKVHPSPSHVPTASGEEVTPSLPWQPSPRHNRVLKRSYETIRAGIRFKALRWGGLKSKRPDSGGGQGEAQHAGEMGGDELDHTPAAQPQSRPPSMKTLSTNIKHAIHAFIPDFIVKDKSFEEYTEVFVQAVLEDHEGDEKLQSILEKVMSGEEQDLGGEERGIEVGGHGSGKEGEVKYPIYPPGGLGAFFAMKSPEGSPRLDPRASLLPIYSTSGSDKDSRPSVPQPFSPPLLSPRGHDNSHGSLRELLSRLSPLGGSSKPSSRDLSQSPGSTDGMGSRPSSSPFKKN